jgi:uncharacterized protein YndB with AHSA1/START domain
MTDITSLINDTHREIGERRIAGSEVRTVVLRRSYDAPIEDVWDACTDPDRLNRWFLPVTGELRVGGRYQLEGNAGGEIRHCEPPHLLTLTWLYGEHPASEVELRLSRGAAGDTLVELEHGFTDYGYLIGVGVGWEPALYALDLHLHSKLPDGPAKEWRGGEPPAEVEELINRSSQLWTVLVEAAGAASG